MNKTAIKNFAVWARRKLIADVTYKAGMLGITENGIAQPLKQSTKDLQFFDIGTGDYAEISGAAIRQRNALASAIRNKEKGSNYKNAFRNVVEEVAYTWFNRLIAVRFMEVNEYLPSRIRVLSAENPNKLEPDFVTAPFDTDMEFTPYEKDRVLQLKEENRLDELFRMLFIKQCNKLGEILPELFEQISDYTELLLNISFTDKDGVIYHLIHDISEDDFNVSKEGQVEIIGWMYQYYNTEPKDEVFALLKKNVKITKERIPAATQLFTPDWIVRYMVENSLGRLWVEGHPNDSLKAEWKYYLDEAEQEPSVVAQLEKIRAEYAELNPEDITIIDPCMGSGHILVYAFDVLMQIYETQGYTRREAAKSILLHNIYGIDIDTRAYQLAYFAVMMKARQYNRRIFNEHITPNLMAVKNSGTLSQSALKRFGKQEKLVRCLMEDFKDAEEYGSILNISYSEEQLDALSEKLEEIADCDIDDDWVTRTEREECVDVIAPLVRQARIMGQKYDVVSSNPPYLSAGNMSPRLLDKIKKEYSIAKNDTYSVFIVKCQNYTKLCGYYSMITMQGWMFTQRFEELRLLLLKDSLCSMLHIGYNSFPELNSKIVQATSFVFRKFNVPQYLSKYCDLTNNIAQNANKQYVFEQKLQFKDWIEIQNSKFSQLPGNQFAYWITPSLLDDFIEGENLGTIACPRQGLATGDNELYLRVWNEVPFGKIGTGFSSTEEFQNSSYIYAPYNKGGDYRKWYGNRELVIKFDEKSFNVLQNQGNHLPSKQFYFLECATWSALTTSSFSCRYCENGFVFDTKGSSLFCSSKDELLTHVGFLNCIVADVIFKMLSPTVDYNAGTVANVPILIRINEHINTIVQDCITNSKQDWDSFETSWDFIRHPLIMPIPADESKRVVVNSMGDCYVMCPVEYAYTKWMFACEDRFNHLKANEEELNRIFIDIYGLQDELTPEVEDKDVTVRKADLQRDIKSLISYAVGCMFGRYSLDVPGLAYAGGEWDSGKYSTFLPDEDNCIPVTDEEYFHDDIVGRLVDFIRTVYGADTLEENLDFIAGALGNKGKTPRDTIRQYFLNDFFKDHCQTYSVTGSGRRPIYWLFDSGKQNGFKALVYMHRWTPDTVGNLRVEYLHRMQTVYEKEIENCQETMDNSLNSREISATAKRKEKLIKQLKECRDYDALVGHIAGSRIGIDLDDGVKVNYRLVQTGRDGRFCGILADAKDIMIKEDSEIWQRLISGRSQTN